MHPFVEEDRPDESHLKLLEHETQTPR